MTAVSFMRLFIQNKQISNHFWYRSQLHEDPWMILLSGGYRGKITK